MESVTWGVTLQESLKLPSADGSEPKAEGKSVFSSILG
jgi:hypothetical protein